MGSDTKTTKVENTPWAPAQPYITGSLEAAKTANDRGTGILDANQGGINAALAQLNGNLPKPPPYFPDARAELDKTINGDYINKNPYTAGLADLIAQKTGAQYNSTFGAAGAGHSGLAALLSGQGVGDALGQFYNDNYNTERANQMNAVGMAPAFNADEATASNAYLNAVNSASAQPGQIAGQYANTVTSATSPYVQQTTTEKSDPSLFTSLTTGLGAVASLGGALSPVKGLTGLIGGAVNPIKNIAKKSYLG